LKNYQEVRWVLKNKGIIDVNDFAKRTGLDQKRPSTYLDIKPKKFNDYTQLELQKSLKLESDDSKFELDLSNLENGVIYVPVFKEHLLKPFQYSYKNENYPSYGNYIGYKIHFLQLHLAKITQEFGVMVLRDDERFLKEIVRESKDHYFIFDFEENVWKKTESKAFWTEEQNVIHSIRRSDEVVEAFLQINQSYDEIRSIEKNFHNWYDPKSNNKLKVEPYLHFFKQYFELFYIFGEIDEDYMNIVSNFFNNLEKILIQLNKENSLLDRNSKALGLLKTIAFDKGGWVYKGNFFPNFAYSISLLQPATSFRNNESKQELQQAAIAYATYLTQDSTQPFHVLFDQKFKNFCKEKGFHISI
jgi:hypothetical protein